MKNKLFSKQLLIIATATVLISSCKKKDEETQPVATVIVPSDTVTKVFISCEGKFIGGTGTLSIFNTKTNATQNDIFKTANGFDLGNIAQSVSVFNNRVYIVVNNANKVEVVNDSTIASVATISGLTGPRYFLGISESKGYITQWGVTQGQIEVVNLTNSAIIKTINCGTGTECMLRKGDFIWQLKTVMNW